jgi:hypothetical protein
MYTVYGFLEKPFSASKIVLGISDFIMKPENLKYIEK